MADPTKVIKGGLKAIQAASKAADEKLAAGKLKEALEAQQAPMTRPQGTGLPLMPRDQGMYTPREQKDLPRMVMVDKARAANKSPKYNERTQDLLDSPKARKKVDNLINKGKDLNIQEWYGTEPLRQVAMDAGRTPEQFESMLAQLASASQRNPVDKQNQMGSYLYYLSETGQLPENSLLLTNKLKKALKDDPSLAEGRTLVELPTGYGSLAQGDIFNRALMISQGKIGEALPPNKKLGTFYENLLGNLQPVTVDVNALRGPIIEQGDPRWLASKLVEKDDKGKVINSYKPREMFDTGEMTMREAKQRPGFWEAAPKGAEYAGFEELWQRGAKRHGLAPAEAQALGWYGSGVPKEGDSVTALKTKPENYVDNLERLIKRTAEQTGKSPTEVMDDMVTGKGFLRKEGGAVSRQESKEDMARFQKRFAMHKAIGGHVKKMAGGGRVSIFDAPAKRMASGGKASIFDKPVHMIDGGKVAKGVMGAVNKASRMADEKIAEQAIGKAAESAGMKAPVTANKPLTNLQDFHTSLGDRIRQGAVETQNMIESMPFKYDKGQRVFTDDSAKKNRAPYEILMRTRYGNQVMRDNHPTLGPNMGQTIRDPETGKAQRTPYEPGYRVRGEIGEMILPESAIKGSVEKARGGLVMAGGGNVLKGNILAGASWNSLNKTLGNELTTLTGQPTTNTSVGGATTADTYKQLMDFINGGGSFDPNATVFLQTGGVDFITGVPREEVKNNIEQIISVLDQQGVNVVLTGAPYAASMDDVINNNFDPRIDPLFEEIAAAHSNVALVDSMGDILQDKSLLSDAIHPNETGTRRYNDDVMGALTALQQRENIPQNIEQITQPELDQSEPQRPVEIPAETATDKASDDSDVIPTDKAENDSDVAEAIAQLGDNQQDFEIAVAGDNMDDYQPPQPVSSVPDYSRAYEALGGADVVSGLRDQFLGMGIEENTIQDIFSKYYPSEYQPEFAQEQFKRGGAVGRESPADMARFKKRFAMHKAIGGGVKKMANGGRASIFDAPVKRFDRGGPASPEESSASDGKETYAGMMAEFLAKAAKDQGKEELSSLKKPRAATDLLNRGVLANNPVSAIIDMVNMGLVPLDVLGSALTGRDIKVSSDKPFLGSEHLKDLMNEYNITSGEERPMMETALSFASPVGMIKGAQKTADLAKKAPEALNTVRGGLETMSADAQRPFRSATLTMEGVAPDLGQKGGDKFKDLITKRMISGEGAPVGMERMGGRKTEQTMGQGLYENFAKQLETNPMVGITIPRAGNLSTNKRLIADIGTAGRELGQEMVAAHKFTPLMFKNPKDATAMMIGGSKPLTKDQILRLSKSLPGMIVSHSPKNNSMFVAPFEGDALDYKKAAQAASEILGKGAKVQFGKADSTKDIMYRGDYEKMEARPPSAESTEMRNRLKKAEERIVRGPSVSQSQRQSPPSTLTSTVR